MIIKIEKYKEICLKLRSEKYSILLENHFDCIYTAWHFYTSLKKVFESDNIYGCNIEDEVCFDSAFNKLYIWLYIDYRNWLVAKIKPEHQFPKDYIRITVILDNVHEGVKMSDDKTELLKMPLNLWENKKFFKYVEWLSKNKSKFMDGIIC